MAVVADFVATLVCCSCKCGMFSATSIAKIQTILRQSTEDGQSLRHTTYAFSQRFLLLLLCAAQELCCGSSYRAKKPDLNLLTIALLHFQLVSYLAFVFFDMPQAFINFNMQPKTEADVDGRKCIHDYIDIVIHM